MKILWNPFILKHHSKRFVSMLYEEWKWYMTNARPSADWRGSPSLNKLRYRQRTHTMSSDPHHIMCAHNFYFNLYGEISNAQKRNTRIPTNVFGTANITHISFYRTQVWSLPCFVPDSVSALVAFCSTVGFLKLLHGFVKFVIWISLSCCMDMSKLINGFLQVFLTPSPMRMMRINSDSLVCYLKAMSSTLQYNVLFRQI